jgi:hypothetical protein
MVFKLNCKIREQQNEYLNNIIAINPEAVNEARKRDKEQIKSRSPYLWHANSLKKTQILRDYPPRRELNF